jgi:IMP dehydrogenase
MMGSIFCKTFESACPKFKDDQGNTFGKYRGQASANFQEEYFGGVKNGTVPEGIDFTVKINKSAKDVIEEFSGALRSSMTYLGANNFNDYHKNAEFFESSMNYLPESKPRKESPNP